MNTISRRMFGKETLGALLTYSVLETLFDHDAFADQVKPVTAAWLSDVNQLGMDLKDAKVSQADWQKKVEQLFAKVNLPELLTMVDFDKLAGGANPPDNGVRSLRFSFQQIKGVPEKLAYGKQIFAFKKGRSVVPHGHNNMATAFLILSGEFHGRHYDRLEDQDEHLIIKPTIDRPFGIAEFSTVTDYKDNVHWFKARSETGFILNIHAMDVNPSSGKRTGRIYVDPDGERLKDGLIRAKKIDHDQAHKLYG